MSDDNKPLKVAIEGEELVIRVKLDTLVFAVQHDPQLQHYDRDLGDFFGPEVVDRSQWAREMVSALQSEEEDGTTLVHLMLDKAALNAIESGAEGIHSAEDMADRARAHRDFPPDIEPLQSKGLTE